MESLEKYIEVVQSVYINIYDCNDCPICNAPMIGGFASVYCRNNCYDVMIGHGNDTDRDWFRVNDSIAIIRTKGKTFIYHKDNGLVEVIKQYDRVLSLDEIKELKAKLLLLS